jgi:hypothetical protein
VVAGSSPAAPTNVFKGLRAVFENGEESALDQKRGQTPDPKLIKQFLGETF